MLRIVDLDPCEGIGMEHRTDLCDTFQDERIHDIWESAYRQNPLQDRFNDVMMDRILRYLALPGGGRVLDAGCGIGDHALRFAKRGFHCVGVDISKPMLKRANERAQAEGLQNHVAYVCCGLEDLSPFSDEFDAVHCRGVLMHIPRWEDALREICRVLRPGGRIVIMETNHSSVEMGVVRLVRLLRKSHARVVKTPAGIEFHRNEPGHAPLTRVANIPYLIKNLEAQGVRSITRIATEFWDIARFPAGVLRDSAIRFNRFWFRMRLFALLSCGNAVLGEKAVTH